MLYQSKHMPLQWSECAGLLEHPHTHICMTGSGVVFLKLQFHRSLVHGLKRGCPLPFLTCSLHSSLIFVWSYSEPVKGEKLATHFMRSTVGKRSISLQFRSPTHCRIRYGFYQCEGEAKNPVSSVVGQVGRQSRGDSNLGQLRLWQNCRFKWGFWKSQAWLCCIHKSTRGQSNLLQKYCGIRDA